MSCLARAPKRPSSKLHSPQRNTQSARSLRKIGTKRLVSLWRRSDLLASHLFVLATAARSFSCERLMARSRSGARLIVHSSDGVRTKARSGRWRNGFAACSHIFEHQPNRVLGHGERLLLILAVGDDLGQCRHADSKAAVLFRLENNGKLARLIDHDFSLLDGVRPDGTKVPGFAQLVGSFCRYL